MVLMKVLIANIPWITEEGKYGVRAGSRWAHTRNEEVQTVTYYPFPFFMAYTTAVLKKGKVDVTIKDCLAEGMDAQEYLPPFLDVALLFQLNSGNFPHVGRFAPFR